MASCKNISATATARLKNDYMRLNKDPVPYVTAEPLPTNILIWHYVVRGPEKTPYEGESTLFPLKIEFDNSNCC
jgi:ubiquitin-conjugating enzyme E2 J2